VWKHGLNFLPLFFEFFFNSCWLRAMKSAKDLLRVYSSAKRSSSQLQPSPGTNEQFPSSMDLASDPITDTFKSTFNPNSTLSLNQPANRIQEHVRSSTGIEEQVLSNNQIQEHVSSTQFQGHVVSTSRIQGYVISATPEHGISRDDPEIQVIGHQTATETAPAINDSLQEFSTDMQVEVDRILHGLDPSNSSSATSLVSAPSFFRPTLQPNKISDYTRMVSNSWSLPFPVIRNEIHYFVSSINGL
jgi:hypothetical protein